MKDGKASVEITQNKSVVAVMFDKMVQRNVKSGFEKRVRCLSPLPGNDQQCKIRETLNNLLLLIIYNADIYMS